MSGLIQGNQTSMIIILESRFVNYKRITPAADDITIALQDVGMRINRAGEHFVVCAESVFLMSLVNRV